MNDRVVITGMGILAPNGHGLKEYEKSLRDGVSGICFIEKLKELNFGCQVGGIPKNVERIKDEYFDSETLIAMSDNMIYAGIAGIDCYKDAGLPEVTKDSEVDWNTGAIIGTGIGGMEVITEKLVPKVNSGKTKRLGSTIVEQVMCSSVSAKLGGLLALGGQVTTNSSACTTGTEAIYNAFIKIRSGSIKRMMAGGAEGSSPYIWAGFDGMKVLNRKFNETPEKASRPMSESAAGFIPGAGAGILMLESLESAKSRGARIYAEIIGGHVNSGGQRNGGSMTAPNSEGVIRAVRESMSMAKIGSKDIDAINGHLTATFADPKEVINWVRALEIEPEKLPLINSTKSLIGHGLGAAGGMEAVATVLQLHSSFIHGSLNCEDLHPNLKEMSKRIIRKTEKFSGEIIAKSSFGFGDVNGCLIFKKWNNSNNKQGEQNE